MSLLLALLICVSTVSVQTVRNDPFYDLVLDSHIRHSVFVAVDVESDAYSGRAIIENRFLFGFLNETKGFNKEQYKSFMKDVLIRKERMVLLNTDFEKWHFVKVKEVARVDEYAARGQEDFVNHYFRNRILKDDLAADERNAVINRLFEWEMASVIDDESGYLRLLK